MIIKENIAWTFYQADSTQLDEDKVGKWMYFFDENGLDFVKEICQKAINEEIVKTAKHSRCIQTNPRTEKPGGVACFYLHHDDIVAHKKVIAFFLTNKLISKTKYGKYYNISFKLDNQTRAGQYGESFQSDIKLSSFIDLSTGEWLK